MAPKEKAAAKATKGGVEKAGKKAKKAKDPNAPKVSDVRGCV